MAVAAEENQSGTLSLLTSWVKSLQEQLEKEKELSTKLRLTMDEPRRLHSARVEALESQVRRLTKERDKERDDHAAELRNYIDEWTLKLDSVHERERLAPIF